MTRDCAGPVARLGQVAIDSSFVRSGGEYLSGPAGDASIARALSARQRSALTEAYHRHAGAVAALARRVTGDVALGDEVTQEIFTRLWEAPRRFHPERGSLRGFLLAETHSRAVDLLRSDDARRRRERLSFTRSVGVGCDVEREVLDLALAERVEAAMDELPSTERDAIRLAYFAGHSYREVAVLLGEAEGTIKTRIRSGFRRLRAGLSGATLGEGAETDAAL